MRFRENWEDFFCQTSEVVVIVSPLSFSFKRRAICAKLKQFGDDRRGSTVD